MTRVIFYTGIADKGRFLKKFLLKKVFEPGKTAFIYASEETVAHLDDDLWMHDFLPHARLDADVEAPILLGSVAPPPEYQADMLICLRTNAPAFSSRFPVYVDLIDNSEDSKRRGRDRYRYFKDHGYPINVYKMQGRDA